MVSVFAGQDAKKSEFRNTGKTRKLQLQSIGSRVIFPCIQGTRCVQESERRSEWMPDRGIKKAKTLIFYKDIR